MNGRREERQSQRRRAALEAAMALPEAGDEALYFHDHTDLLQGLISRSRDFR